MQKWEYLIVDMTKSDGEYINIDELGKRGWELIAVQWLASQLHGYFKRPLSESGA